MDSKNSIYSIGEELRVETEQNYFGLMNIWPYQPDIPASSVGLSEEDDSRDGDEAPRDEVTLIMIIR